MIIKGHTKEYWWNLGYAVGPRGGLYKLNQNQLRKLTAVSLGSIKSKKSENGKDI